MKAAVQHKFGSPDAITIENLPKPTPTDDQVLIRVRAATVGVVDTLARKGEPAAPSPALFAQAAWTLKFGRRKAAIASTGLRPAAENTRTCCI